jgi:hypothetical protein
MNPSRPSAASTPCFVKQELAAVEKGREVNAPLEAESQPQPRIPNPILIMNGIFPSRK